jgi:hypothetical protein
LPNETRIEKVPVNKIWNRLEQRFGSPEIIESCLKQRIVSFPTITTNENKRLFDFKDLVLEIAALLPPSTCG